MPQTNVKSGPIAVPCGEDLTAAKDHLVRMSSYYSEPHMYLPQDSRTEPAVYLVLEGAAQFETGSFQPLSSDRNVRVPFVGTGDPGDFVTLANPEDPNLRGKVERLPDITPGTYNIVGILEENVIDGQLALIRPLPFTTITIT